MVFSLSMLIGAAVAALVVGLLLGVLLTRKSSSGQKLHTVETQLEQTEQNLNNYQQEVTEHFAETAKLVNNLTQNYRDVHEHLAGSALKLANVDISRELLSSPPSDASKGTPIEQGDISQENFHPPKDWAPSEGTLSEDYGLKEEKDLPLETSKPKD